MPLLTLLESKEREPAFRAASIDSSVFPDNCTRPNVRRTSGRALGGVLAPGIGGASGFWPDRFWVSSKLCTFLDINSILR